MEVKIYDRLVYFCITSMGNVYHNEKSKGDGRMRTEQEILKDFEKLGYEVVCNSDRELVLEEEYYHNHFKRIHIKKQFRLYAKLQHLFNIDEPVNFDIQEHKLLNELFIIWGWI